jgi:hypothetical protein
MAFINGSFNMLGAKLASGIFDAVGSVLEKIPFMGAAAQAVRSAQDEAEQAVTDISNIMHYEADNLKSEWGGIMAEMPKQFADSYAQNAANPLIDMNDKLAEADALSASIAGNIAKAGTAAATVDPKVTAAAETPAERIARQEAEARAKAGTRGGGGGGSNKPFDPVTGFGAALRERGSQSVNFDPATSRLSSTGLAIERTKERFSADKTAANIRADLARMEQSNRQASDRAARFEEQGMFGAAERLRGRIDRRVAEEEKRLAQKYNLNVKEQAKTPEERAREEEEMRQKNAPRGGGGGEQGLISQIHSLLQKHMPSIDEKLPQHALA